MNPRLSQQIDSIKKNHADLMAKIDRHGDLFSTVLDSLSAEGIEPISISLCGTMDLSIAGDKEVLKKTMRVLRRCGLQPVSRPKEASPTYSTFWCEEDNDEDGLTFLGESIIWLSFSSSQCRYVKTGTKMVEEDIFEVQCE